MTQTGISVGFVTSNMGTESHVRHGAVRILRRKTSKTVFPLKMFPEKKTAAAAAAVNAGNGPCMRSKTIPVIILVRSSGNEFEWNYYLFF